LHPAGHGAASDSFVTTALDPNHWRAKYFDALATLEREHQRFSAIETALKRIARRLCTAALGQTERLDAEIRALQAALRGDCDTALLDRLTAPLTAAIQELDERVPLTQAMPGSALAAPREEPSIDIGDPEVRATLSLLLSEIRKDSELAARSTALDEQLDEAHSREALANVLRDIALLVSERIQRLEHAKREIQNLVDHMLGKLDEIAQFVSEQNRSQREAHASSETLHVELASEMRAMGESVETAADLQQLRAQVRSRLECIDRHVKNFRERETARAAEMTARNERLRFRIAELEAKAQRLQSQLQDEQRLSTIDALTKIPNRLAYEKRLDDELKRCQRFDQPTCLAVWDVDHFKRINDTYGHRAGDRVLAAVAECLASRIRSTDFVARYGGEEFVMILPGTSLEAAIVVVEELRLAIRKIGFHFRGTPVDITISIGLTALRASDSPGTAFERADKALYRAKQSGRNRCIAD
jgi:diguanylate cyclase